MKKAILIIAVILIILAIVLTLISFQFQKTLTGKVIETPKYSWTKAICNQTHCQDYEISCQGSEVISQTPITGAVIEKPENWEDPRNENLRERICEE